MGPDCSAIHVLSGLKTSISAAIHGADEPRYVFYLTAATLLVGAPAVALDAVAGGVEGVVLALVALELAGALACEVAARHAFGQFGAVAVAGALVWLASHAADLTDPATLALAFAAGATVPLRALACESFRAGSVRTVRDVTRPLGRSLPADDSDRPPN